MKKAGLTFGLLLALAAGGVHSQTMSAVPVVGGLLGGGLESLPIAGELLGGEAISAQFFSLDGGLPGQFLGILQGGDSAPLGFAPVLENELFETLLIGNLLTGNLAADLVPVSAVFLNDPLSLPDYFLAGGTVLAPVIELVPAVPVLTAPLAM